MSKIVWLLEETIIAIHHRQIAEHGGGEGLRDEGLLSSALARPQNLVNLEAGQDEKFVTFQRLGEGSLTEDELADWIRKRSAHSHG